MLFNVPNTPSPGAPMCRNHVRYSREKVEVRGLTSPGHPMRQKWMLSSSLHVVQFVGPRITSNKRSHNVRIAQSTHVQSTCKWDCAPVTAQWQQCPLLRLFLGCNVLNVCRLRGKYYLWVRSKGVFITYKDRVFFCHKDGSVDYRNKWNFGWLWRWAFMVMLTTRPVLRERLHVGPIM